MAGAHEKPAPKPKPLSPTPVKVGRHEGKDSDQKKK